MTDLRERVPEAVILSEGFEHRILLTVEERDALCRELGSLREELLWLYGLFFDTTGREAKAVDPEGAARFA